MVAGANGPSYADSVMSDFYGTKLLLKALEVADSLLNRGGKIAFTLDCLNCNEQIWEKMEDTFESQIVSEVDVPFRYFELPVLQSHATDFINGDDITFKGRIPFYKKRIVCAVKK